MAKKNIELSTDDTYIYETNIKGLILSDQEKITFTVPVSDMGEKLFNDVEAGQLLIRYITNIV